jgi:acyl-CoA synthetase (AMP-forming)/AMP-acid ligase II
MTAVPVPRCERLVEYLDHWTAIHPHVLLDELHECRRTYGQVARDVRACAASLLELGVRPGQSVAMLTTPRPEFLTVFLALSRIGAIWVGLNPSYRQAELMHVVSDSAPTLVVSLAAHGPREFGEDIAALAAASPAIRHVVAIDGSLPDAIPFAELLIEPSDAAAAELDRTASGIDPDGTALVIYTSGTTGRPKGAMISHRAFAVGCWLQAQRHYHDRPRTLANLPVDHVGGLMDQVSETLVMGGSIHFMERFNPQETLELLQTRRITRWGQIPTMFQMVLSLPEFDRADLSSLQQVGWGGAPMTRTLVGRLRTTGAQLGTVYGLTESCVAVAYNDDDADDATLAETVGRPDPRLELRLVDDDGREVEAGLPGEIQVRNPCLMTGYLHLPAETRAAFTADRFLRTGDIGVLRPDGNLTLVGRSNDMFKSGGYNVYPREIELVLESHPLVGIAAVIPVSDPVYHEVGHAFVTARDRTPPTSADLQRWCRERLANYKIPKRIVVRDELPLLPVGKVDKRALATATTAP